MLAQAFLSQKQKNFIKLNTVNLGQRITDLAQLAISFLLLN